MCVIKILNDRNSFQNRIEKSNAGECVIKILNDKVISKPNSDVNVNHPRR